MESRKRKSFSEDAKESSNLFSNTREVTNFVRLCIQARTENDMKIALSRFYDKLLECTSEREDFSKFKVLQMFVLDYIYKQDDVNLSMISRTVYAYVKQILRLENERDFFTGFYGNWIPTHLPAFTTFETKKGESVRDKAVITSIEYANLAFTTFLVKFGLVSSVFPSQANDISMNMIDKILDWFNLMVDIITQGTDLGITIQPDSFLNHLQEIRVNFRRCMMTFIATCIIAEYRAFEVVETRINVQRGRWYSTRKMKCLDLFIQATPETCIAYKDIEYFFIRFLNHHLKEEVSKPLLETAKTIFTGAMEYYQPRTLKDLTRCKIRTACLRNSVLMPQKVYELSLPTVLKKFLLFENFEFWKILKEDKPAFYYQLQTMLEKHNSD